MGGLGSATPVANPRRVDLAELLLMPAAPSCCCCCLRVHLGVLPNSSFCWALALVARRVGWGGVTPSPPVPHELAPAAEPREEPTPSATGDLYGECEALVVAALVVSLSVAGDLPPRGDARVCGDASLGTLPPPPSTAPTLVLAVPTLLVPLLLVAIRPSAYVVPAMPDALRNRGFRTGAGPLEFPLLAARASRASEGSTADAARISGRREMGPFTATRPLAPMSAAELGSFSLSSLIVAVPSAFAAAIAPASLRPFPPTPGDVRLPAAVYTVEEGLARLPLSAPSPFFASQ